ncbi:MAG: diaminobutyrate--2-oxoglutarate transaminase [Clostridia bacterium]|nr:diaminobutyrate--2-oxoglutarate transaminase [Clostridia bacterium]
MNDKEVFENYESEVRSYCRIFNEELDYAKNSKIRDVNGKEYIDFFCGAGALNYGHNNPYIKEKVIEYLQEDRIIHALDMYTKAKCDFIRYFEENILKPRNLDYKIQFPGPTGTNAVESALKLARKVKKRNNIWCFMGAFHGMTLGTLALTTEREAREGAGVPLNNVTHIPAPYMFEGLDTIKYMQTLLDDDHSGVEKPAAIILETVQAEGGIMVFEPEFLQALRKFCDDNDILLIVDDIQVGCCRTGTFFSFERANIVPDMVTLSKSIGGYGFPLALTLFKRELDIWKPGEHNGTFRGNQIAMVSAKAGLEYFNDNNLEQETKRKGKIIEEFLNKNIKPLKENMEIRGIGFIWGIDVHDEKIAKQISIKAFEKGLIVERAGRNNEVVKVMPPLVIEDEVLNDGLNILKEVFEEVISK